MPMSISNKLYQEASVKKGRQRKRGTTGTDRERQANRETKLWNCVAHSFLLVGNQVKVVSPEMVLCSPLWHFSEHFSGAAFNWPLCTAFITSHFNEMHHLPASRICPFSPSLQPTTQNPQVYIFHNRECILVGSVRSTGFENDLSIKVKQRHFKVPPKDRQFYFSNLPLF